MCHLTSVWGSEIFVLILDIHSHVHMKLFCKTLKLLHLPLSLLPFSAPFCVSRESRAFWGWGNKTINSLWDVTADGSPVGFSLLISQTVSLFVPLEHWMICLHAKDIHIQGGLGGLSALHALYPWWLLRGFAAHAAPSPGPWGCCWLARAAAGLLLPLEKPQPLFLSWELLLVPWSSVWGTRGMRGWMFGNCQWNLLRVHASPAGCALCVITAVPLSPAVLSLLRLLWQSNLFKTESPRGHLSTQS